MTRFAAAALTAIGLLCLVPACDSPEPTPDGNKQPCGTEWVENEKDPTVESIMGEWGAPCMQDSDCTALLGADGVCVTEILGVYELPGGFCSKDCVIPDTSTIYVEDAPDCDAAGGVTCIGAEGLFTACAVPCDSDDQCGREGYGCRTMPTLAAEGDPTFCLMNPVDCCTTESGECAS